MNQRLENYIKIIDEGLRKLPPAEREAEIAELKQHLRALTQAREELGQSEERAFDEAIEQFGQPSDVRRHLLMTYRRRRLAWFRQSWLGAMVSTILCWFAVAIVCNLALDSLGRWILETQSQEFFKAFICFKIGLTGLLFGAVSNRVTGWRCLPVIGAWTIFSYCLYVVPVFRHDDMPEAMRRDFTLWFTIQLVAPYLFPLSSLRRFVAVHKA